MNILIVEDDQNCATAMEAMLRKSFQGTQVIHANNPMAALETLQHTPVGLIISDWNMPARTGSDLLHDIRRNSLTRKTPFLMVTARADRASVLSAIQAGANDYVCKPFDKQSLMQKVGKLIGLTPATVAERKPGHAADEVLASDFAALTSEVTPDAAPPLSTIEEIVGRLRTGSLGSLSLPSVAMKIQEIINSEDPSIDMVCDVVKIDPSLTAKLIGIANSAYYARMGRCQTLNEAIVRIGFKDASQCVMALTTKQLYQSLIPEFNFLLAEEWQHAIATAAVAEQVARRASLTSSQDYFTLGLLHDIGKVLLINILQDLAKTRPVPELEEVRGILDQLHPAFGKELLSRWNFAPPFLEITYNHHDAEYLRRCAKGLQAIGFANRLADLIGADELEKTLENDLELQYFAHVFNMNTESVVEMLTDVSDYLKNMI